MTALQNPYAGKIVADIQTNDRNDGYEPTQVTVRFTDGSSLEVRADAESYDQYSSSECLRFVEVAAPQPSPGATSEDATSEPQEGDRPIPRCLCVEPGSEWRCEDCWRPGENVESGPMGRVIQPAATTNDQTT